MPLIPDGANWKATLLIEFRAVEERRVALAGLRGVEDRCWGAEVAGPRARVFAIADEDLERENDEKNVGGAFPALRAYAGDGRGGEGGCGISIGMDHDNYRPRD